MSYGQFIFHYQQLYFSISHLPPFLTYRYICNKYFFYAAVNLVTPAHTIRPRLVKGNALFAREKMGLVAFASGN